MIVLNKLNDLIKNAIVNKRQELEVLRAIKTEFTKYETSGKGAKVDDISELQILQKMLKVRQESADIYHKAGRIDLYTIEHNEALYINHLLPSVPTVEDIKTIVEREYHNNIPKKEMGIAIKRIKELEPMADGKMVSEIVKEFLV